MKESEEDKTRLWIKSHLQLIERKEDLEDYRRAFAYLDERKPLRWHPATERPGKCRILMAFTKKSLKPGQYLFMPVRYFSDRVIPAEGEFRDHDGEKMLPVAWMYYYEAIKGITEQMAHDAALYAWGWWPDDK